MKISKLFHWLYALLMLLPFAFFVPSVLYYAFNDNATMQTVEVPKTETIAVDFNQNSRNQDFTNGATDTRAYFHYQVQLYNNSSYVGFAFGDTVSNTGVFYARFVSGFNCNQIFQKHNGGSNDIYFNRTDLDVVLGHTYLISNDFVSIDPTVIGGFQVANMMVFDLTKMYGLGNEPTTTEFINQFPNTYYPYNEGELMQITYDTGETKQLISNTDIINYAWESIWNLPLFSWTKITFVSVPFSYLTGIFGLGASNSLNYVFGYFVTISIVWLVFDLLLYVPMLAHNWIDKARIE